MASLSILKLREDIGRACSCTPDSSLWVARSWPWVEGSVVVSIKPLYAAVTCGTSQAFDGWSRGRLVMFLFPKSEGILTCMVLGMH